MKHVLSLFVLAISLLGVGPARAEEPTAPVAPQAPADSIKKVGFAKRHGLVVTLSLSTQQTYRSLLLEQGDVRRESIDTLWAPLWLWGGARFSYGKASRTGFRGDVQLGLSYLPHTGSLPLALAHTTSYSLALGAGFRATAGARVVFMVDLPAVDVPQVQLGIPLGLAFHRVELTWFPALQLPLGRRSRDVFGGTVTEGAAVHFVPLSFHATIEI